MVMYKVKFIKPYKNHKVGSEVEIDPYKAAQLKEKGFVEGEDIPSFREAQKTMFKGEQFQRQVRQQFNKVKSKKNGSNN